MGLVYMLKPTCVVYISETFASIVQESLVEPLVPIRCQNLNGYFESNHAITSDSSALIKAMLERQQLVLSS